MAMWIYQLNPQRGSFLDGRREVPTNLENLFRLEVEVKGLANWGCNQHFDNVQPGDSILVKMGGHPALGVVAIGTLAEKRNVDGEKRLKIRFDRPRSRRLRENPIPIEWLRSRKIHSQQNLVDARRVEKELRRELARRDVPTRPGFQSTRIDYGIVLTGEGQRRMRAHLAAERKRANRDAILAASPKPYRCEACTLSFEEEFGPDFAGLIHVHHKIRVSGGARRPTRKDFALLCPNCHAMAHWCCPAEPRSVQAIGTMVRGRKIRSATFRVASSRR